MHFIEKSLFIDHERRGQLWQNDGRNTMNCGTVFGAETEAITRQSSKLWVERTNTASRSGQKGNLRRAAEDLYVPRGTLLRHA